MAAIHEGRLGAGAFDLLIKFLGMKFPCRSGLGKALDNLNVVALRGVINTGTGKFIMSIMTYRIYLQLWAEE